MKVPIKNKVTRFRAYQLGNAGSSFSYFNGTKFTLLEARYNEANEDSIKQEMHLCNTNEIHDLHITSWDIDHCSPIQLEKILTNFNPKKIEYPGYTPHTEAGKESLSIIKKYEEKDRGNRKSIGITPSYIRSLDKAESYGYRDTLHHPKYIDETSSNNNSTVKHFRSGSFNVLSLGDVECNNIASGLRRQRTINQETDVMILAHHGADNGFTTSAFIRTVRPSVAIASSDYANQFKHPKQEIRDLLYKNEVKLFTTKNGDIVIYSIGSHEGKYKLVNLKSGSTEISSTHYFLARKSKFLSNNRDTIRAKINRGYKGPKR
ncbi:ComEC/Rec2 family competence protein [Microbulbifer sp. VAAC004]|uniref:ComEC/Rec2 family competence protein n=1 Tax=unclassified Microbulbifer TaxID=2619833 RepID=UPI00403A1171